MLLLLLDTTVKRKAQTQVWETSLQVVARWVVHKKPPQTKQNKTKQNKTKQAVNIILSYPPELDGKAYC